MLWASVRMPAAGVDEGRGGYSPVSACVMLWPGAPDRCVRRRHDRDPC